MAQAAVQAGTLGRKAAVTHSRATPPSGTPAVAPAPAAAAGTGSGGGWAGAGRAQGIVMAAVLAVALWQGIAALTGTSARQRLSAVWDMPSFLAGKTAAAVNYALAHYLPSDELLRATGGALRWRLFHSGGPQVWAGCDGWLYVTEELRPYADADAALRARGEALARVAARLREQGVALLVAVVPDKARMEPAQLCGAPRSAQAEGRSRAAAAMLAAAGVPAVDLAAALGDARARPGAAPLYYRTDTHWNQAGAAVAARAVAAALDRAPVAELDRTHPFTTASDAEETPFVGDLLRLMGLDKVPDGLGLRPLPDRQRVERTADAAPQDGSPEGGGLLDDVTGPQVALVGSSFSLNANFHGRLQEALRAPVGNFAQAGGGFAGAVRAYLEGAAFQESPPKLVVWEMPERALLQPLDAADRALLDMR